MVYRIAVVLAGVLTLVCTGGAVSASTVLFLGDSLTAGYGVASEEAYPAVVDRMLAQAGMDGVTVINAGISGSTSAGSLSRLRWHSRQRPDILFLALGANDGLRGLGVDRMERNLGETIVFARQQEMLVILAGMEVPPNYGQDYADAFRQVFYSLRDRHEVVLMPFLLQGVGGVAELNQPDGLHPNPAGHAIIAGNVYPYIRNALARKGR